MGKLGSGYAAFAFVIGGFAAQDVLNLGLDI